MTNPGIGDSPRRREDYRLVTGAGTFGDDFTLPGQTFATIARSPHAHAILRRIETTRACALPGVLAVLTAADYLFEICVEAIQASWHGVQLALHMQQGKQFKFHFTF